MSNKNSKDQQSTPQNLKTPGTESAGTDNPELLAALARLSGVLEKTELSPLDGGQSSPEKPAH